MKTSYLKYSIILWVILFSINDGNSIAQSLIEENEIFKFKEDVKLITDRDVYCVNEKIYFSAYNLSNKDIKELDWSKVLYVEIVTNTGRPVVQSKFEYGGNGTKGELTIPEEVLTGNYYLRAYTKWMRNYSPYNYFYKLVKIINPYNKDLLHSENGIDSHFKIGIRADSARNHQIEISTDKKEYKKRELVTISTTINSKDKFTSPFSVTVVKKEAISNISIYKDSAVYSNATNSIYYIPETRGVTLTGRVINKTDSIPIPYAQVSLTIFTEAIISYSILTTDKGRFYFSLPYIEGKYEVFTSVNHKDGEKLPIMFVDNDFCTKTISLPFEPFIDSESENNIFNELSLNSQLTNYYKEKQPITIDFDSTRIPSFYGTPSYTILFKDYIELPTMQDYFYELLTNVGIRKKNNKRFFRISSVHPELGIYDPLVLVDFVAVSNIDWVLSISPRKIKKIEIIESPFIRGNMIFGGIISIISTDGDFAGVNLPSSGQFFNYSMYSEKKGALPSGSTNIRIPDSRNVLYWNPGLLMKEGEKVDFKFSTGDTEGEYYVMIRGFTSEGKEATNYATFKVK